MAGPTSLSSLHTISDWQTLWSVSYTHLDVYKRQKYERPDVKTSGIVRDVASDTDTLAVKDTTTFANIPWRSVFTDPQLQSIIEKGLNNNVNLLNAALNVKMAEEQLKCAKLAFVPALSFTPQGTIASWDGNACLLYTSRDRLYQQVRLCSLLIARPIRLLSVLQLLL